MSKVSKALVLEINTVIANANLDHAFGLPLGGNGTPRKISLLIDKLINEQRAEAYKDGEGYGRHAADNSAQLKERENEVASLQNQLIDANNRNLELARQLVGTSNRCDAAEKRITALREANQRLAAHLDERGRSDAAISAEAVVPEDDNQLVQQLIHHAKHRIDSVHLVTELTGRLTDRRDAAEAQSKELIAMGGQLAAWKLAGEVLVSDPTEPAYELAINHIDHLLKGCEL